MRKPYFPYLLCLIFLVSGLSWAQQPPYGGGAVLPRNCTTGQVAVADSRGLFTTCGDLSGGGDMLSSAYTTGGKIRTTVGGTQQDSSGWTGVVLTASGTWSVTGAAANKFLIGSAVNAWAVSGYTIPANVAQGALWYGSAVNAISALSKSTAANYYLKNSGTNNNPAWAAITASDLAAGDLAVAVNLSAVFTVVTGGVVNSSGTGSITATALSAQYIDWSQSSGATSIKNKPTLGDLAAVNNPLSNEGDILVGGASGAFNAAIAGVAANRPLLSGGVNAAPAYAAYYFSGTNALTYTFPAANATLAGLDTSQALSNKSYEGLTISTTTATLTLADGITFNVQNGMRLSSAGNAANITIPNTIGTMALSGTLTNTKWCTTDGSVISCTADTPTGAGTITQVGDITTGAAFTSGVAGKYLYFTNDVSGSMLLEPTQGSGIGTKTVFLPIPAAANGTLALTASPTFTALVTVPAYAAATAGLVINATQVQTSAAQLNYLASATGTTGAANSTLVYSNSPTLIAPTLGAANATTINLLTITRPATGATFTIADGKTLTVSESLTVTAGAANKTLNIGNNSLTVSTAANTTLILPAALNMPAMVQGDLLYGSAAGVVNALAKSTGANYFLRNSGTNNNPAWAAANSTDLTDTTTIVSSARLDNVFSSAGLLRRLGAANYSVLALGTLTDTYLCVYTNSTVGITCNTSPTTYQTAGSYSTISGTPANHYFGVWVSSTAIKGVTVAANTVLCTNSTGEPAACTNLTDTALSSYAAISGTPSQYQFGVWNSASAVKGVTVAANKVVCTDTNGQPAACSNLTDTALSSYAALTGANFTGLIVTAASAAGAGAGFRLPHGTAPNTATNGDIWTTSSGLYARINGSTVGPFGTSTATIAGTLASNATLYLTTTVASTANTIQVSGISIDSANNLNLPSGASYQINGQTVLSAGSDGNYGMSMKANTNSMSVASGMNVAFASITVSTTNYPFFNNGSANYALVTSPQAHPVTVASGGLTAGGIPYVSASDTLTTTAATTRYTIMYAGDSTHAPGTMTDNGTQYYSLTSGGTNSAPVWAVLKPQGGGTGVANGDGNTISFAGGSTYGITFTLTGATNVTLPTSGTVFGSAANTVSSANLYGALTDETGSGSGTPLAVFNQNPTLAGFTVADATNIVLNATTGTKLGTATNQKLGFFNQAPIVQPTGDVKTALAAATNGLGLIASPTIDADTLQSHNAAYFQTALTNPVTGTGTQYYLAAWNSTNGIGALNALGSAGDVLTSNGAGNLPTFQAAAGGGNVSNNGTPALHDWGVWYDSTHIKAVTLAANSVACTNSTGEPAVCSNLSDISYAALAGAAFSGAVTFSGSGSITMGDLVAALTTPKITTGIKDANNNVIIGFSPTASAVDYLTISNGAAGNPASVGLSVAGANANITLAITSKAAGLVTVQGVTIAGGTNALSLTNGDSSLSLTTGQAISFSGAYNAVFVLGGATNVTLPTSGTLYGNSVNSITSASLYGAVNDETGSASGTPLLVFNQNPTFGGFTVTDATNVVIGTTTGTKFGTATNQKLGFFNAAPVVQQSGDLVTALSTLGLVTAGTVALAANASNATTALSATNIAITDDTTTSATMYPIWVTTSSGNQVLKVASNKLTFNPSTGVLTATTFSGSGASLSTLPALTSSSYSATTSANLSGLLSDETGNGSAVFANAPIITAANVTGAVNLGIRDTSAAFDVVIGATSSTTITAQRALTIDMKNAAHTIVFGTAAVAVNVANAVTFAGDYLQTHTVTNASNATYPTGNFTLYGTGSASFNSANLAVSLADETGNGAAVFANAAVLTATNITGITNFGIRDTSAAYDVVIGATSSTTLDAQRALTINMKNAAHTLVFGTAATALNIANALSTSGDYPVTITSTGAMNISFTAAGNITVDKADAIMAYNVSAGNFTVARNSAYVECTANCTITPLAPAAGIQVCVRAGVGKNVTITFAALGANNYYENPSHAAYGTANSTLVGPTNTSNAAICLVGKAANAYGVWGTATGAWTAN